MSDEKVKQFRMKINAFKLPYIQQLNSKDDSVDETQDVEKINTILKQIDILYAILKDAIVNGGKNIRPDDISKAVCAVFENSGLFQGLDSDEALKEGYLRVLKTDLKTYPLTPDTSHINMLNNQGVASFQHSVHRAE
jgi:hypothetical protein